MSTQERVTCPLCNAFNMAGVSACVTCNTPLPQQVEVTLIEPVQPQQPSTEANVSAQLVAEMEEERQRLEEQLRELSEGARILEGVLRDEIARLQQELENALTGIRERDESAWYDPDAFALISYLGLSTMGYSNRDREEKDAIERIQLEFQQGKIPGKSIWHALASARQQMRDACKTSLRFYCKLPKGLEEETAPDPANEQHTQAPQGDTFAQKLQRLAGG